EWAEKSGIPFEGTPQAKNTRPYGGRAQCLRCNTCEICPTGARYSPDFTFKQLLEGEVRRVSRPGRTDFTRVAAQALRAPAVGARVLRLRRAFKRNPALLGPF